MLIQELDKFITNRMMAPLLSLVLVLLIWWFSVRQLEDEKGVHERATEQEVDGRMPAYISGDGESRKKDRSDVEKQVQ